MVDHIFKSSRAILFYKQTPLNLCPMEDELLFLIVVFLLEWLADFWCRLNFTKILRIEHVQKRCYLRHCYPDRDGTIAVGLLIGINCSQSFATYFKISLKELKLKITFRCLIWRYCLMTGNWSKLILLRFPEPSTLTTSRIFSGLFKLR